MGGMDVIRWPVPGEHGVHWQVRAFGQCLPDLDVDVRAAPPLATTAVLHACLAHNDGPATEQDIWRWTVNRRLQGLLAVTTATRGERWTHTAYCGHADCGSPMDLPLSLRDFQRHEDPATVSCAAHDEPPLTVAIPCGEDQLAWLQHGDAAVSGCRPMLSRLLRDGALPDSAAAIQMIEAALADADPLTALTLHATCPECGGDNEIPLDLEPLCLSLLAREQPRLLDQIHRLALAYHWSEAEILAIPPVRRREYLDRLDEVWS